MATRSRDGMLPAAERARGAVKRSLPVVSSLAAAVRRIVMRWWGRGLPLLVGVYGRLAEAFPPDSWTRSPQTGKHRLPTGRREGITPRLRVLKATIGVAAVCVVALAVGGVVRASRQTPEPPQDAALRLLSPQASAGTGTHRQGLVGAQVPSAKPDSQTVTKPESQAPQQKAPQQTSSSSADSVSALPNEPGPEYGIDVSNYNGPIDWKQVAANGKRFAYVLATDGDGFTNPLFQQQFTGAKAAGLLVGAYHFARFDGSATGQANLMLQTIRYRPDGQTLPPELDMEINPAGAACYGLSPSQMQNWVQTFAGTVKQATGQAVVLYANSDFWSECMGNTDAFTSTDPLFLASYGSSAPSAPGGWQNYTFWQNSSTGSVSGVDGDVDLDVFNGSLDQLRKFAPK